MQTPTPRAATTASHTPTWQFRWSYSRARYVYRYTTQWDGEAISCDGYAVVDDFGNLVVL